MCPSVISLCTGHSVSAMPRRAHLSGNRDLTCGASSNFPPALFCTLLDAIPLGLVFGCPSLDGPAHGPSFGQLRQGVEGALSERSGCGDTVRERILAHD